MRTSCVICLWFLSLSCLFAQNAGPVLSVSSTADTTKTPEVIRLNIKVYAKGKDLETAKEGLVAAEKKLLAKLGEAGAEVIVAHAGLSMASQNLQNRYNNVANMLNSRIMNMNGGQPVERQNPSLMERMLSIDLRPKLKTKDCSLLLGELLELTRKNYQEWTGIQDAFQEDMKQLEEMNKANPNMGRMDLSYYRNDMSYYQQDVRFQIAARVTREDRLKLYQEALKRARSLGTDLAEAAEMKLGTLQSISTNFTTSQAQLAGRLGIAGDALKFPIPIKEDGSESVAVREVNVYQNANLDPIVFQITLNTSFKLEPR
ncbi:MAG TPA: SIMPL domain-containing protein [Gemmatales bacterium]|nr:SIMPL domain-containing protein [Gemmatales bacterium]